jgi:hypothetical protein
MTEKVKVIFQGQEEILNVIKNHGSIVKALGYPSENCPLVGSEIQLGSPVGKGNSGTVFLIALPGETERKYVVKRGLLVLDDMSLMTYNVDSELEDMNLTWDDVKDFQPRKTIKAYESGKDKRIQLIIPPKLCKLEEAQTYKAIPKIHADEIVTVKKGAYLCNNESFSEFVNGVYAGQLYREHKCINFFNVYSTFVCQPYPQNPIAFYQYIFMDRIDGELAKCVRCIKAISTSSGLRFDIIDSIYIQTMFAIASYQKAFKLSHNDLHTGNVFVEYVKPDQAMTFNGQLINDADFYHYKIRGDNAPDRDIYFPATGVIVKIGDYGLSVKYSHPIVGDEYIFKTGHNQGDGDGPWIPNKYYPSYDSLFFSNAYGIKIDANLSKSKIGELLSNCLMYMCGKKREWKDLPALDNVIFGEFVRKQNGRPVLKELNGIRSAIEILKKPIYAMYGTKPDSGKIVTLGTL